MEDLCLKNADQAEFDDLMLLTGLCVLIEDNEGNTIIVPASEQINIDRIGPITIWDYDASPPTSVTYPEYHTNLFITFPLSDDQRVALTPFLVEPGVNRHREWAK